MALPLGTALAYSLVPALAGYAVALLLLIPARRAAVGNQAAMGPLLVIHVIPLTGVLFALVAAILASQQPVAPDGIASWLGVVGAAAALTCVVQGLVGGRGFPVVAGDVTKFGRLLIGMVLPETFVVLAFVAFMLRLSTG
jgi:F0F1-type ATP synthase membrane subunit c/vacuolar-type H+-ATPase subunit K